MSNQQRVLTKTISYHCSPSVAGFDVWIRHALQNGKEVTEHFSFDCAAEPSFSDIYPRAVQRVLDEYGFDSPVFASAFPELQS